LWRKTSVVSQQPSGSAQPPEAPAPELRSIRILLSYRREDTSRYAGRLYEALAQRFGEDHVFMDIDSMGPGDFREAVEQSVVEADVLLVVIGRSWLTATDSDGRRRLDNPSDWVRVEIEHALERDTRVIPLLVQGAEMPSPDDLPESVRALWNRQAVVLDDERWRDDVQRLIAYLEKLEPAPALRSTHEEAVPTHTDNPAKVDELGRKGFARILARRIRDMRTEEARNSAREKDKKARKGGSFLVHLHAPWGAGKTSLLNFLADELRKEEPDRWVVVNFNAWRHQRIVPPWWWLMTTMYSEAARDLASFSKWRAARLRVYEWFWRLKGGWPGYVMLLLAAGVFLATWQAGFLSGLDRERVLSLETAKGFVIAAAAIITPLLTVWGLVRGLSRWVFATSARGARRFIDNTRDPMQVVRDHVRDLVHWIGKDVVVLIDDLDRCKGPYVVELLEGIQTLFRDVPVTYVVAADRDWLSDSYAAEYRKFVSAADEPGRPLGYLFLEKTFQISAQLPPVSARLEEFWSRLLRSPNLPSEQELDAARVTAKSDLAGKRTEETRQQVASDPGATPADVQARLETLAEEMASERSAREAAHTLEPFRSLLGPNPNPRDLNSVFFWYVL